MPVRTNREHWKRAGAELEFLTRLLMRRFLWERKIRLKLAVGPARVSL